MRHNRPGITLLDKENRVVHLIDMAFPNGENITRKVNEKIINYVNLSTGIKQLRNVRIVKNVPIIIGACGEVDESF